MLLKKFCCLSVEAFLKLGWFAGCEAFEPDSVVLLVNGRRMVMALTVVGFSRESVMKLVGMTAEKVSIHCVGFVLVRRCGRIVGWWIELLRRGSRDY
jgi:hypothetical protein